VGVPGYEVTSATLDDIQAILDLQEQNLRINGGALSVRFSREWFEKAIVDMPIVVARSDENVVGYVVSTSLTAQAHEPIIQVMLRAYPGSPGAYNYGPICVAESHRGQGLALGCLNDCGRNCQVGKALPLFGQITFRRETCTKRWACKRLPNSPLRTSPTSSWPTKDSVWRVAT